MYELHANQVLAAGYTLAVIPAISVLLRFYLQWARRDPFRREDVIVLFAFIVLVCLDAVYIYVTPIVYRVANIETDSFNEYSGFEDDAVTQLKVTFATSILFPTVLWSVKLSLMSISRRVIQKQPDNVKRWWWALLFLVILTYIGCFIVNLLRCRSISDYLTPGKCSTSRNQRAQLASVVYVIVADIVTDLLIMAFPIIILRRVQLKRSVFLRTSVIFSVGSLCVITSLARAVILGVLMGKSILTFPWLSFWDMLDCAIAVIVACLPSFAAHYIWRNRRNGHESTSYELGGSKVRRNGCHTVTTVKSTPSDSLNAQLLSPQVGRIEKTYDVTVEIA